MFLNTKYFCLNEQKASLKEPKKVQINQNNSSNERKIVLVNKKIVQINIKIVSKKFKSA